MKELNNNTVNWWLDEIFIAMGKVEVRDASSFSSMDFVAKKNYLVSKADSMRKENVRLNGIIREFRAKVEGLSQRGFLFEKKKP
jgi:hypothetical protein